MSEGKRVSLLRVLQILEKYSDAEHPLTHEAIAEYLYNDFDIEVDRKCVAKQITLLHEVYDVLSSPIVIISDKRKGTYIEQRTFEDSELRLLIDGVLSSRHITPAYSKALIEKLCRQANQYFRPRVKNICSVNDWNKTDNMSVFLSIELIDEAIERGKQIKFNYNKYGADKKLHKSSQPRVSPYQLILHNQRYYLMARNEKYGTVNFYRLDLITDMEIQEESLTDIQSVEGYQSGIDYKKLATGRPYMFTDKLEYVEFLTDENTINQVIDWFGKDVKIEKEGDRYKVGLLVSPSAMEYWALQYVKSVEVVSPKSLRERIKKTLLEGVQQYGN